MYDTVLPAMTTDQRIAYQWALTQHYDTAAARHAKELAKYIAKIQAPSAAPLTCKGCESEDSEEMCEQCSRAIREDCYRRKPAEGE